MAIPIPKKIHQVWVGPNSIPSEHKEWMEGWKRHHPNWEHRLWRDEAILRQLPDEALALFHAAESWAGKADVARVWLVHQLGGVYVDADFQCLKPIGELLHGCRAFTAIGRYERGIINGLFGAVPQHPFLKQIIDEFEHHFDVNAPNKTGPMLFRKVVQDQRRSDVRIFEREIFMPVTATDKHRLKLENKEHWPNSYAAHHFAGSWNENGGAQSYYNKLSRQKVKNKVKQLVRPLVHSRAFHAYGVGMERTGMEQVSHLLSEKYRSQHEPYFHELKKMALVRASGGITDATLRRIFWMRDRQVYLDFESDRLLARFCDVLVDVFPDAIFILTVRQPLDWLRSIVNWHLERPNLRMPGNSMKPFLDYCYGPKVNYRSPVLKENGLYPLDGYLNAWREHNSLVVSTVLDDRLCVLWTHEIPDRMDELASWMNVSIDTGNVSRAYSNESLGGHGVFECVDQSLLQDRIAHHCGDLLADLRSREDQRIST
jgi:mannosyltransferase OCH1-like enzyme